MTKLVTIIRKKQDETQTLGFLHVVGDCNLPLFADICLERGWRNNEQNVSCIPVGMYELRKEWSPKFQADLWEIYGVEGRSECKFHAANYWRDLNGCVAPGMAVADIDGDGRMDVTSSRASLERFHEAMGDDTKAILVVKNGFPKDVKNIFEC